MWTVTLPRRAEKELAAAPPSIRESLGEALSKLQQDPRPPGCKKLKGRLECWRIRIGPYRILYDIDDSKHAVAILKIGPRKDVYR